MNSPFSTGDIAALRTRGLLLMLVTVSMWAIGPLFVKYFTDYYDVWTQNAFRYSCAAVMLVTWTGGRGALRFRLTRAQWFKLMLVTVSNITMQTVYAAAFYFIYPSVASLVGRVNIIFVTLLSFLIFHDERRVISSPRFLAGAALALTGVILVILGRDAKLLSQLAVSQSAFWIGTLCSVGYALFAAVYALAIKHAVRDIPARLSFTHVSWTTALGLCIPMFAFGGAADLPRHGVMPLLLMALSALLSIVIAHTCYYTALRHITAVVASSMMQLIPVITCFLSAMLYGDTLSWWQIAGGIAVITGAWLAALAQAKEE